MYLRPARHRAKNGWASMATLLCLLSAPPAWAADVACRADPLDGRPLYLRGSFNTWNSIEAQRFIWACSRYELVTRIQGEHRFKIGDEGWSPDADFGRAPGASVPGALLPRGADIPFHFGGVHRIVLAMTDSKTPPQLSIEACPNPAPLGETVLFLRGTLNNWSAMDDYAFQYSCDAYYLNVKASGRHEFKIADSQWSASASFGAGGGAGDANYAHVFDGEHTLRVAIVAGRAQLSIGAKTFADPSTQVVADPLAQSLRFDSRSLAHKKPFGAVTAGSQVEFALAALPGVDRVTLVVETRRLEGNQERLEYAQLARLPMSRQAAAAQEERWTASHRFADIGVYGYWFEAQIAGQLYVLQNNAAPVFWTREKGTGGPGAVGQKPTLERLVRRFRQTVYAADFKVPEWAADTVYYYIFPERFRNGDKANDPRPGVTRYHDKTVEFHANWLDKPYRPGSGDGSDEHFNNDFFGGDLAGIIDKLDYIRDLGANAIYMTPVFEAASNHKYDTADYRRIDPAFGSNADFERLTREAAKRGLRVILDASLNHTGVDSVYFDRFGNHKSVGAFEGGKIRADSPYASWYNFDASQIEPHRQYKGWVGVSDLPELNKNDPGYRQFAYGAKDGVMQLWLDRGAAGWRMDVAPWVPDDFWREWRSAIKAHRADAITIAETWWDASKFLLGDMFDSTMNYIFRNTVIEYAAGGKATALYANIELMREAYPPQAFYALMNLLSTHDQARSLHHLGWHDDTRDPAVVAMAKQRFKLAVFFQMVFPGSPAVYYGDEVGVTGGDDPLNRATYPWADLGGKPDLDLLAEFKKLIQLRQDHAVLRRGSIDAPLLVTDHLVVLARRLGQTWAITATNNAATAQWVDVAVPAGLRAAQLVDVLGAVPVEVRGGRLRFEVPALYGRVLLSP